MATKTKYKYEADDGTVYSILMNPDTFAVAGPEPTGGVNTDVKVKISKSNNEFGIRPRFVRISRIIGTAPDDCRIYATIPVLTLATYTDPTYTIGATLNYKSIPWEIVSKQGEDF